MKKYWNTDLFYQSAKELGCFGIVYCIVNNLNNKLYIGQTIQCLNTRWQAHINQKSDSHISRALIKYGKENFSLEIIQWANSREELNYLEKYYIETFNTIKDGYNIELGGYFEHTPEIEQKRVINLRRACQNLSNKQKDHLKDLWENSRNKVLSDKEKIHLKTICKKKPIMAINLDSGICLTFNSGKEASKYLNMNYKNILRVARKERKQNYNWTFEFMEETWPILLG